MIVGNVNTPLSKTHRRNAQNVSKDTEDFKNTNNQIGLTEIYKTLYPITAEYMSFSSAWGPYIKIGDKKP